MCERASIILNVWSRLISAGMASDTLTLALGHSGPPLCRVLMSNQEIEKRQQWREFRHCSRWANIKMTAITGVHILFIRGHGAIGRRFSQQVCRAANIVSKWSAQCFCGGLFHFISCTQGMCCWSRDF